MVPAQSTALSAGLNSSHFKVVRPWLSFLGRKFWVYAPDGSLVSFVRMPIFKLKMEFTLYADQAETQPMLTIKARSVVGINMVFDVTDPRTGERLGGLRRLGLKSIFRDRWEILDPQDTVIGKVEEEGSAFLRRMLPLLLGEWGIELHGARVAGIKQVFKFFAKEFTLDMSQAQGRIDPRFAMAVAIFALIAESAREQS